MISLSILQDADFISSMFPYVLPSLPHMVVFVVVGVVMFGHLNKQSFVVSSHFEYGGHPGALHFTGGAKIKK